MFVPVPERDILTRRATARFSDSSVAIVLLAQTYPEARLSAPRGRVQFAAPPPLPPAAGQRPRGHLPRAGRSSIFGDLGPGCRLPPRGRRIDPVGHKIL